MKTVWLVLAEEDASFIAVCTTEEVAKNRADTYEGHTGDVCEIFEEELEER